jgi:preprotein translocase subunit Sec61beta
MEDSSAAKQRSSCVDPRFIVVAMAAAAVIVIATRGYR